MGVAGTDLRAPPVLARRPAARPDGDPAGQKAQEAGAGVAIPSCGPTVCRCSVSVGSLTGQGAAGHCL